MRTAREARRALATTLLVCALPLGLLAACATPQSGTGALSSPGTADKAQAASNRSAAGVVRGRLVFVGGPFPGSPRPLSGTVTIKGESRVLIAVGRDGRYVATLPAGTYRLAGSSPWFGSGAGTCHAQSPVSVVPKGTAHADVVCQGR